MGAADIATQTIKNSFEVGPEYRSSLSSAHDEIRSVCSKWPGPLGSQNESRWVTEKLSLWTETVKRDIRLGQWVMCTLAAVAVQAVTDLYERPSTRMQRPLLDPLFPLLQTVHDTVEGGLKASYESNRLAGKMLAELYNLIGWE